MTSTTTSTSEAPVGAARIHLGFFEFVITIALMTATVAMAIDIMLPALPSIGHALGCLRHWPECPSSCLRTINFRAVTL